MDTQAIDCLGLGQGIADHALLQAMPVAVYTTDEAGIITFYNEAAARLWGRRPVLGEDRWCGSWQLYRPDGTPVPLDECPMAVTLKENRPVRGAEAVLERPDGTLIPVIPYPTPLLDAEGRLIGAINVLVDITERKQAERALRQREQELHEAQRIARMGHWRLDLGNPAADSSRLAAIGLEWSAGTHLLMGTSDAGYAPRLKDFLRRVHPEDRCPLIHAFRDCLHSGKTSQWEFRVRNDDGRDWVAWIEGGCETSGSGKVLALFGICKDVTEQRRMQATLREACEAAQAADRAKSAFLACMSHELRTPLNAIIGFSDLLQEELFGPLGSDQYLEYAADISRSGHHLLELVNDLLDMARIEAGVVALHEEAIDLPMLIREAVNLASGLASGPAAPGNHKIDIRLREPAPLLIADRRRLRQVLINLVGNAVKFTPGGGRIEIALGEEEEGRVPITVTDTGIGIAPDKISGLCQPFSQIEDVASRRFDGSGMGLFITKALVERHGGALRIASWPGRGTTVTISLPSDRFVPVFAPKAFPAHA
ncbi:MAG TPA: PAS domain-containing sensor histidine kinase [Skermanella sp.]|nr:PAS domain-containing sensor histidine kinase [Skermanella sp.]